MSAVCVIYSLLVATLPVPTSSTQGEDDVAASIAHAQSAKPVLEGFKAESDRHSLASVLADGLLKPLNLEFKVIDGNNGAQTLGVTYDYTVRKSFFEAEAFGAPARSLELEFSTKGTAAFDTTVNPDDFLQSKARLAFQRHFGLAASGEPLSLGDLDGDAIADKFVHADDNGRRDLKSKLASLDDRNYLQFKIDVNAGFESNQRFTARNGTLGASMYLDADTNAKSTLTSLNFFDYPFAVTRWLTKFDNDAGLSSRGDVWPIVRVAFDNVEPDGNDPRSAVGETDSYERVSVEAAMRTGFVKIGDEHFDIAMNYRYFQELGASSAVKQADLDEFDYFAVGLVQTSGAFFATYRTGRLPFDSQDGNAVELGWKFNF